MPFCVSSHRGGDINISNLYFQKVGQGHGVQFLQCHYSMANVKIYKRFPHIFCDSSYCFTEITCLLFFTFKVQIKVKEYSFRNHTIRWQLTKFAKDSHTFLHWQLPFQIYKLKIVDLQKVGLVTEYNFRNYVIRR